MLKADILSFYIRVQLVHMMPISGVQRTDSVIHRRVSILFQVKGGLLSWVRDDIMRMLEPPLFCFLGVLR